MISGKISTLLVSAAIAALAAQPALAEQPKRSKAATTLADSSSKTHSAVEELVVTGQRAPQAVARAVQQEAPNLVVVQSYAEIKKLPDISAAEAVRRLPGMSLETDEGEGRYVNCRGLDADLNSTTFGGLRLPPTNNASPFGGYRAVALDSIPIGLVGAITVTKSNLPEQDAEALGCTIEITPKTAPPGGEPFVQGDVAGGYEPLRKTAVENFQVTAGGHFGGAQNFLGSGPFSIVLTAAYNEDRRGIDDVEPGYFNNPSLPYSAMNDLQQRDYELHRRRHALGIDLGFQPDADNSWYLRAFEAGYTERYKRQFLEIIPDGNAVLIPSGQIQDTLGGATAINKSLRDESETSTDRVFVAGGKNQFGNGSVLDYRIGYTQGTYHKPYDVNSQFSYAGAPGIITYAPTGPGHVPVYTITGADYLNWSNYSLAGLSNGTADNFDRELSGALNYLLPIRLIGSDESLKFGVDARQRHKRTVSQPLSYSNLTAIPLTQAIKGANETYYGGVYQNGPDIVPGYLQGIFGSGAPGPSDLISADQQYLDVHEDVYAGYGEYRGTWGKFSLIAGARVERTNDKSNAFS
ncbi:MAG TPA: TonB-dependent receptor plug domain-containing protein, partial [Sphingomicrobium sp.]|nr:TonB-dependent receptor plug domain-containing protein [Sphingomicrobium sp.]